MRTRGRPRLGVTMFVLCLSCGLLFTTYRAHAAPPSNPTPPATNPIPLLTTPNATPDLLSPRPQIRALHYRPHSDQPVLGPRVAPVTIDFFLNLGSSQSRVIHDYLTTLRKRHPHRVRVIYRLVTTERYRKLSVGALEAATQHRFEAFLQAAFARRRTPSSPEQVAALSREAGVAHHRVIAAWHSDGGYHQVLDRNNIERKSLVDSTPGLLFNGAHVGRASRMNFEQIEAHYRDALAEARQVLARGISLDTLYPYMVRSRIAGEDGNMPPYLPGAVDGLSPSEARDLDSHNGRVVSLQSLAPEHSQGPMDAPVVIHIFCNFLSANCALLKTSIERLRSQRPHTLRLVFHHLLPADSTSHHELMTIHQAAECAAAQHNFWRFYDRAYQNRLPRQQRRRVIDEEVLGIARTIGLDEARFQRCMVDPAVREHVHQRVEIARAAGIRFTPSLVIGGRLYLGLKAVPDLRRLVDAERMPGLLERVLPTELPLQPTSYRRGRP